MQDLDITKLPFINSIPGEILFCKLWGSRSHNTYLPDSDFDYLALYQASNKDLLSMRHPPETIDNPENVKPDFQAHEVGKFCHLLMKGNPGIIEMLWTDKFCYETDKWLSLKRIRNKFLCKQAIKQYLGYAEGQLKKLTHHAGKAGLHTKGGEYNEKWAYHIVRLLGDALSIARGNEPLVWKDGLEREILMSIRRNEWSMDKVEREARSRINEIESSMNNLPEFGDEKALNDWLLGARGL